MTDSRLRIQDSPEFREPRLIVGFSGWMDGGDVSTGTLRVLVEKLEAHQFAEISPEGFYIYNFPGAMDLTALFRPHCRIREGLVRVLEFPKNAFYGSVQHDVILFLGKEPNLDWESYADHILRICARFGVRMIYFIGSVSGLVPHTRDPHMFCSVSDPQLKPVFDRFGIGFSDYEGPASIATYLTVKARQSGIDMVNLVATVPAYVQGNNPKCIDAVVRRIAGMIGVELHLDDLRAAADEFEKKLNEVVNEQPELAESIVKLEQDYDNEVFNNEMTDLKQWLHQKGIRLD
ncbi:MAG: PAC2 family protein [Sedimentisphaerales bacterium]|nr:PAC2 family protein [Sedimentisphaerales bacterium]